MKFIIPTLKLKLKDKKSTLYFNSKLNFEKGGATSEDLTSVLVDPNINFRTDESTVYITEFDIQLIISGSILKSFVDSIPDTKKTKDLKLETLKRYLRSYQFFLTQYTVEETFNKVVNGEFSNYVNLTFFNNYYNFHKDALNDDIFYFEITNQNNEVFAKTNKLKPNDIDERYASDITAPINDETTASVKEGFNSGENILIKYKNDYYNQSMTIYTHSQTVIVDAQYFVSSLVFNNFDLNILNEG